MHLIAPKMSLNVPGRRLPALHPLHPPQPLLGVHSTEESVVHLDQDHVGCEVLQATAHKPTPNHGLNRHCPLVHNRKPCALAQIVATPATLNDENCTVHHPLPLSKNVPNLDPAEPSLQPLRSLEPNAGTIKFVTGNPPPDFQHPSPGHPSPHIALDHSGTHLATPHLLEAQLPGEAPEPPAPDALDLHGSPQLLFVASSVAVHTLPQATTSKVLLQRNDIRNLGCKVFLHLQIPSACDVAQVALLQQSCGLVELVESSLPQVVAHHSGFHNPVQALNLLCRILLERIVAASVQLPPDILALFPTTIIALQIQGQLLTLLHILKFSLQIPLPATPLILAPDTLNN
mmetsp:Transcript_42999/g.103640  ORF Transcript_42999/g.103640 Transcript_42999/m.103640 type:complete len:345 (+) Transcript_42999:291-1325(+)